MTRYWREGLPILEQLRMLEDEEEFTPAVIAHARVALTRRNITTSAAIREQGYKYFQAIPGIGRKGLGVIGRLIGEEWPPPHTLSPALRVSSEVLIRILEGRGYVVIREPRKPRPPSRKSHMSDRPEQPPEPEPPVPPAPTPEPAQPPTGPADPPPA